MPQLTFLRTLFTENKLLDTLRIDFLTWFYREGTLFLCDSYDSIDIVSPAAYDYVYGTKPAIFALFHGHMQAIMNIHPRSNVTVLISQSRDGEIIARAAKGMGIASVRGSPNRRGVKGALEFISAGKTGRQLAYTTDGPRGPRHQVNSGVIRLASLSGMPIIPLVCRPRNTWRMPTWDRFMVAHWSTPCAYMYNDPIFVSADASDEELEQHRATLEQRMHNMYSYLKQVFS